MEDTHIQHHIESQPDAGAHKEEFEALATPVWKNKPTSPWSDLILNTAPLFGILITKTPSIRLKPSRREQQDL